MAETKTKNDKAGAKTKIHWIEGNFTTPPGEASFVNIDKPSDKFGPPEYDITVQWSASDPAFVAFRKQIEGLEKDYVEKVAKKKWQGSRLFKVGSTYDPNAKTSHEDEGKVKIRFKMAPKDGGWPTYFKGVVDANGQTSKEPWNGDTVRIGFTLGGYSTGIGTGVKPYMKAIQVVAKRSGGGGDTRSAASWFDAAPAPSAIDADGLPSLDGDDLLSD